MKPLNLLGNHAFKTILKARQRHIEAFKQKPREKQEQVLRHLVHKAVDTQFGREHAFRNIKSYEAFRSKVPVSDYPALQPYLEATLRGAADITWPGRVHWFAMSSGTTGGRSKYIPITRDALRHCHFKAGQDVYALYYQLHPKAFVGTGQNLVLGGSHQVNRLNSYARYGDLSAVLLQNLPAWARFRRAPSLSTALMEDWEAKIDKIAQETMHQNITSILGVPTWTVVLIEKLFALTGKDNLADIWPNLELYIHGGVNFDPYRPLFERLIRKSGMHYLETYNASEGFFGMQDQLGEKDLLLMLDYGIFFEFIPQFTASDNPEPVPLWDVETNQQYAVVISTNAGLWRYKIGDTVRFTNTNPYRFRLTGRTQHFINTFGEELIVENAEQALAKTCERTGAKIHDFTAGPIYLAEGQKGGHEWLIEFEEPPAESLERFREILDEHLQAENSDYAAKRYKSMALAPPIVRQYPTGTFYQWMKARNKLGGQNKVPRLANHRDFIEDLRQFTDAVASV